MIRSTAAVNSPSAAFCPFHSSSLYKQHSSQKHFARKSIRPPPTSPYAIFSVLFAKRTKRTNSKASKYLAAVDAVLCDQKHSFTIYICSRPNEKCRNAFFIHNLRASSARRVFRATSPCRRLLRRKDFIFHFCKSLK